MKNLLSILKMDFVKISRIGKNLRFFSCLLSCLILVFGLSFQSLAAISSSSNAFAVNPDYLIGSASNADPYGIATMELTDEDYGISLFSSLGTVTNTISSSGVAVVIEMIDSSSNIAYWANLTPTYNGGRFSVEFECIPGRYINSVLYRINDKSLPSAGNYKFSMDYGSEFSYSYKSFQLYSQKTLSNAQTLKTTSDISSHVDSFSGEFYIAPITIGLGNLDYMYVRSYIDGKNVTIIDGDFAVNFTKTSDSPLFNMAGSGSVESDYQEGVSGSLSDISSSIGDMSESLDSAAENLEYISTSQNLIIQGIDNVIMHISDQLYAFWDQLYNLIHEPTYSRLGDILDAIRNLDLEITVEMKEVTDAVNKMNLDMQNKLQNVQQTITQGFDNSVMESEASKLDDSISEYDEAEQSVIQNVNDSLNDFEFDAELGEYQSIVSVVSDFLQQLYESAGGFKVLINLSMLLSLAGIVIGIYRFGGGS